MGKSAFTYSYDIVKASPKILFHASASLLAVVLSLSESSLHLYVFKEYKMYTYYID